MKKAILEILDYLKYQVENDKCTPEELKSIYEFGTKDLAAGATSDELADFFGQSKSNVRNVIARRPIPRDKRPKRRVYYNFGWFLSMIPESWKNKK